LKEIKIQYYSLAKKHHPDAAGPTSTEVELEASKELFKKVTEAYAILSDETLRKKYDRLIFGDSADKPEFDNEEAYQYWGDKGKKSKVMKEDYEEMNDKIREKLKNFKDYEDFLRNFENHREKNSHRTKLMREEGWKELNDKYDSKYKHF
jgi:DnaJ-class molecular chaperone